MSHDAVPALPERLELEAWAERALACAAAADGVEVQVSATRALSVSVRQGEVEKVEFQRDRALSLSVYFGARTGSASTCDLSAAGIERAVRAACTIARASGEDPCNGLPDAQSLAREFPDLDVCHPWSIGAERALALARECEAAGFAADSRVKGSEGAGVDSRHSRGLLANSLGFRGYSESTEHTLGCALIAGEGSAMQQGYWYSSARAAEDLESPTAVGRRAAMRAAARLGARSLSPRRVPVLFDAEVARSLFAHFCGAIAGGALYRRASFLLGRLNTAVFSSVVNLQQRPFLRRAAASAAFDDEGVATRDRELVSGGVLQGYLLGSYAARKLGLTTTGNAGGVFNLVAEPTHAGGQQALLREMGEGLLVTELLGQGANLVTGDYSRGAAGFWVSRGEIVAPVQEITLAATLPEVFLGIRAIGDDIDTRGAIRCGSVLVDAMTVSGVG